MDIEQLRKVLDHLPVRFFWKDLDSVYLGCNRSFAEDAAGGSPVEIVGKQDHDLPGRCDEAERYRRRDQWVIETGQPLLDYEEIRTFADGREAMVLGSLFPYSRADGKVEGVVGIYSDVSEQRAAESRLRLMTLNDQLTGLPNQILLRDRLDQAIMSAGHRKRCLGLIYLDVDSFKKINNTLGHAVGDGILRLIGGRLSGAVFDLDTVGRMGGDVFILLLRDLQHRDDIGQVLNKLRKSLAKPFMVDDHEIFLTASGGVALYPDDGEDAATLLKNANTALHKAKEAGRNSYRFYSPTMNASALMWFGMETQLRKALEFQQLEVYFQPQIDAVDGGLAGAEALVRWRHPELGLVSPADFIPLAEETGLIIEIGAWVLNEVCVKAKGWCEHGLPLKRVSVNLSPLQFRHQELVATVCSALLDSGLDPSLLELEITESAVMQDVDKAAEILRYFREMGVKVAIDDFGVGYSSLSLLKKFPITLLKIDRTFVDGTDRDDQDNRAIVTAIIAMGHQLGIKVLAEGVETEAQWAFLRESGCDELQGYLFSRPLPTVLFEEYLAERQVVG